MVVRAKIWKNIYNILDLFLMPRILLFVVCIILKKAQKRIDVVLYSTPLEYTCIMVIIFYSFSKVNAIDIECKQNS